MSNLLQRILVAIVAIPLVVWIIFSGGWVFTVFIVLLCGLGADEFYHLAVAKKTYPQRGMLIIGSMLVPALMYRNDEVIIASIVLMLVVLTMTAELWRNKPNAMLNISTTFAGIAYVGGLLGSLVALRNIESESSPLGAASGSIVLAMFIGIWICDSMAYFAGRAFGNHKIFPRVSPNKSWEGSIAGLVSSVAWMVIILPLWIPKFPLTHALMLGGIVGVFGQIGDFAESLLKRDADIKDSSSLIPGHGGILDRFDSVLFVAPVLYLYFLWAIRLGCFVW